MAAKKYLTMLTNGTNKLMASVVTSEGAGNDGDLVSLDATGKLDASVMPAGLGADTVSLPCSESLTAGDFVNIYDVSGTVTVRKANATTNTKPGRAPCGRVD